MYGNTVQMTDACLVACQDFAHVHVTERTAECLSPVNHECVGTRTLLSDMRLVQDGPAESATAQHTSEIMLDASMSSNSEDLKRSSEQNASALDSIEQMPASPRDSRNRGRKGSVAASVEESESIGNDDMDALLAGESCFLLFFWFMASAFAKCLFKSRESLVFSVKK